MKNKNFDESKTFNDFNNSESIELEKHLTFNNKDKFKLISFLIYFTLINAIMIMLNFSNKKPININISGKDKYNEYQMRKKAKSQIFSDKIIKYLNKERERPYFKEINKKRTFEERFPLTKDIKCKITFLVIFKGRKYEVSYDSSMKIKDFILDITYKYIGKSQLIEMNVL